MKTTRIPVIKLTCLAITSLALSACMQENSTPAQVTEQYWNAIKIGDYDSARKLVSSNTQQSHDNYIALPDNDKLPVLQIEIENQYASVSTIMNPASNTPANTQRFDTRLVLEQGQWKIDASQTQFPSTKSSAEKQLEELAEGFTKGMQKNMESLDEAMSEGMQLLNETFRERSSEMSDKLLKGMRELNENLKESIENLKEQREKNNTPDKNNGEGIL